MDGGFWLVRWLLFNNDAHEWGVDVEKTNPPKVIQVVTHAGTKWSIQHFMHFRAVDNANVHMQNQQCPLHGYIQAAMQPCNVLWIRCR